MPDLHPERTADLGWLSSGGRTLGVAGAGLPLNLSHFAIAAVPGGGGLAGGLGEALVDVQGQPSHEAMRCCCQAHPPRATRLSTWSVSFPWTAPNSTSVPSPPMLR
jgi:hypothetical protein